MSLYADYIKEREGYETAENEYGFITYKLMPPTCFIRDLYVHPSLRRGKIATDLGMLVEQAAKDAGCKFLTCTVCMDLPYADRNAAGIQGYGFKFNKIVNNMMYFVKEIQ